jgi:hypothetical protein
MFALPYHIISAMCSTVSVLLLVEIICDLVVLLMNAIENVLFVGRFTGNPKSTKISIILPFYLLILYFVLDIQGSMVNISE